MNIKQSHQQKKIAKHQNHCKTIANPLQNPVNKQKHKKSERHQKVLGKCKFAGS